MTYTIEVHYIDADGDIRSDRTTRGSEARALAYAREETQWELTRRVKVTDERGAVLFNEPGSFT